MAIYDKDLFLNPQLKYRVKPMMHSFWPDDEPTVMVDALKAFGYGGAVINPPRDNGDEFADDKAVEQLGKVTRYMTEQGMDYWIYDENGTSTYAGTHHQNCVN